MDDQIDYSKDFDELSLIILNALHQGDEKRVEKAVDCLESPYQQLARSCVKVWRSSGNTSELDIVIRFTEEIDSVFACYIISEKALFIKDLDIYNQYIFKAFKIISEKPTSARLTGMCEVLHANSLINLNQEAKAIDIAKKLINSEDIFIRGLSNYTLGYIHKLKGKRYYNQAEAFLNKAIFAFELQEPNRYMLNLSKLELSFFTNRISSSELLSISNEFSQIGRPDECQITTVRYKESLKRDKSVPQKYESVGGYYFISNPMVELLNSIKQFVLGSSGHALILGPEGAGKEGIAQTIHKLSDRASKPFIAVNCANFSKELFEAEFFGYEKGSFTGATSQRKGLLEEADGGTIFLDEIGELQPNIQSKFLTLMDKGAFRRIGGKESITINIQFIGATNRNIRKMIEKDNLNRENEMADLSTVFRSDFANRFRARLQIPSLNERQTEIIPLAEIFLTQLEKNGEHFILDEKSRQYLLSKNYPSNIRSLRNFLETVIGIARQSKSVVLTAEMMLDAEKMTNYIDEKDNATINISDMNFYDQILNYGREILKKTQIDCNFKTALVAKKLGISKRTLYRVFDRHNIEYKL